MRAPAPLLSASLALAVVGCSNAAPVGAGSPGPAPRSDAGASADAGAIGPSDDAGPGSDADDDAPSAPPDASPISDGGTTDGSCEWGGAPGQCISTTACSALADHTSYAGECPGPASIECCIVTPSTADNPPTPAGYQLMQQAQVTSAMTTWAVAILNDPATYPMFSTTTMTFGTQLVLARVEWHPPDFQNSVIHRGVTLYVPV